MATDTKHAYPELPADWFDGPDTMEVTGLDLVDKATLVEVPFLITRVAFALGSKDVAYVYADFVRIDGTAGSFNDSSTTGVRTQIEELWTLHKGSEPTYTPRDVEKVWNDVKIPARKGLRVSEYIPEGRKEKARTYYLAANGVR